ncbi:hypothetical protein ACRPK2_05880 [Lactococcus garvieae]|uniref:hypothetical protein n=1 Tax=Lactococcus garvieae TaxID=1363 RepID=UPI003D779818
MEDNSSLIGKIKVSRMPYYDNKERKIKFKARPILILKCEKEFGMSDVTAVPISSISIKRNLDDSFDIEIVKRMYPALNLMKDTCYIRCGKIITINKRELAVDTVSDLKSNYPDLWQTVIDKVSEYFSDIT